METGKGAWLGCQESYPAKIQLPGGWYWETENGRQGFLCTPEGRKCTGYDLTTETMQFGAEGKVQAKGLNLWTVQ